MLVPLRMTASRGRRPKTVPPWFACIVLILFLLAGAQDPGRCEAPAGPGTEETEAPAGPATGETATRPEPAPDAPVTSKQRPPNIVLIVADDLGYGDLGCYGGRAIRTPNLDRLAQGGVRFTDYYSSSAVCAPSRSGMLTGRYPFRTGIIGNPFPKDEPVSRWLPRKVGHWLYGLGVIDLREDDVPPGIPDREITLAEALKAKGYRTGMVGKWHLGDYSVEPGFNPLRHGFDSYLGVPHSNDMLPCPLYKNEKQLEADIGTEQARLTGMYTREAVRFIEAAGDQPFFLYMAHTFPHQPLYASKGFAGKSRAGKFGDAVEEIDWSVGEIEKCLKKNGLDKNTIVLFSSDNGPWFEGSPGGLRGRKGQSYEGGFRVPMIVRWPGHTPPEGVCSQPAMNIDLYPTLLAVAGADLPEDRVIDGRDIYALLTDPEIPSPHEALFFYHYDLLEGVRSGRWKYFRKLNRYVWPVPLDTARLPDKMGKDQLGDRWPLLYDMETDPGEAYNVIHTHPEVAERLEELMTQWEKDAAANPWGWTNIP